MTLTVYPLTLKEANDLVARLHRHHKPAQGHRFSLGAFDEDGVCHGAVIVGRPVARNTDQRLIAEVTRLVTDGTPNACSVLYGAAARAAKAMGFTSIQTFILESEPGTSLKASGWTHAGPSAGGSWSRSKRSRADNEKALEPKAKWVRAFR